MTGPNVPMLNDNALSNISVDVDFLEAEFKRIGREHVNVAFSELRSVSCIYSCIEHPHIHSCGS